MSGVDKLIKALRKLGLTEYEAKAYIASIELGEAEALEIARRSGVPRTRIYDILSRLESLGLIQRLLGSRPAVYVPIPPEKTLEPLKNKLVEEVSQALDRLKLMYASSKALSRCDVILLRGMQAYKAGLDLIAGAKEDVLARIVYLPLSVFEKLVEKLRDAKWKDRKIYLFLDVRLLRREIPLEVLEEVLGEIDGKMFSPPMPFSFIASDFQDLLLLYASPDQPERCYGFLVHGVGEIGKIVEEHLSKGSLDKL
ncbi:MAG TPA: TrmB family transcriptional regulator [Nitrososphaeria archaeon]|nr:TrmB family transcriptional regulator [Nitrososphaeria archaeon]